MTRQEFIDDILDMSDLYNFCANTRGYDHVIEDVYTEDALDDFVNNEVSNYTDWRDLYSFLNDIPTGYDWYRIDCYGDITGIDDSEFEDIKSDLLDELDSDEWFEEEDQDEEEEAVLDSASERREERARQQALEAQLTAVLMVGA